MAMVGSFFEQRTHRVNVPLEMTAGQSVDRCSTAESISGCKQLRSLRKLPEPLSMASSHNRHIKRAGQITCLSKYSHLESMSLAFLQKVEQGGTHWLVTNIA